MSHRKKKSYNLKDKKLKRIQQGEIAQETRLEMIAARSGK
jgi:hypothetical protein